MDGKEVWIGFNTLEGLNNKDLFEKECFANYKWTILDLAYQENSILLYGKDIRNFLPDPASIEFDLDDVLARALYHFEKSLKENATFTAQREFSKGIIKFAFYLATLEDSHYFLTSIRTIANKMQDLVNEGKLDSLVLTYIKEVILFRKTGAFQIDFESLRYNIIKYITDRLNQGTFHRRMSHQEIVRFLDKSFGGFPTLIAYYKRN